MADKQVKEEKSLQTRIKECKQLMIQGMEKTLQHKMVYMYLKDRKKQPDVKNFTVNSKDGVIKMEFNDHEKALAFYQESNFLDKILVRPFNIYFSLALTDKEMRKYYLEGITEENQRNLFLAAYKIGICKLYTSYGSGSKSKLKSTGLLSFMRTDDIPPPQFKRLEDELKGLGIKIYPYVHDKGMKISLNLLNFLANDLFESDEQSLNELAENEAKKILSKYVEKPDIHHLSILVKKKEIENKETQQKTKKLLTSALFEFDSSETAYAIYEKVRIGIRDEPVGNVKLFFHNEENNSFLSLITQGLSKPEDKTEKQFEEVLIENFRKIHKNVLQVNIFPIGHNSSYIGRVYLKSEEDGKEFLSQYSYSRSSLYQFYKEKNIIFDISVDTKTLRKIKNAERKAKQTEQKIKKQVESHRRDTRGKNTSLPPGLGPMMPPLGPGMPPNMAGLPNMMVPPNNMNMMGAMGPRIGGDNMGPMGPRMGENMGMPFKGPMPAIQQPGGLRGKTQQLLRDKERILAMDDNSAKRILSENLRGMVEEQKLANSSEATRLINILIKDIPPSQVFSFLEKPETIRPALDRMRQTQN